MIYVIMGPTGSGKTDLSVSLAKKLNAPIINADAFQIYDEMNIGTGKISKDDEGYKLHYLLNVIKPDQTYSVKQYQSDFRNVFEKLINQYDNIIISGGTGLYIKAALYDYYFQEGTYDDSDLINLSNEQLYQMLEKLDPESLKTLHINNRKRVIRAICIARNNDLNKSDSISMQEHCLYYKDQNFKFYFLNPDRELLYQKINQRVDNMFSNGLLEEVKALNKKYDLSITSKAAIGYKEVLDYINNEISFDKCVDLIKQRSRNYAKRQVTFFKHQFKDFKEFENTEEIYEDIINNGK